MLLQTAGFHLFLRPSGIPWQICTTSSSDGFWTLSQPQSPAHVPPASFLRGGNTWEGRCLGGVGVTLGVKSLQTLWAHVSSVIQVGKDHLTCIQLQGFTRLKPPGRTVPRASVLPWEAEGAPALRSMCDSIRDQLGRRPVSFWSMNTHAQALEPLQASFRAMGGTCEC